MRSSRSPRLSRSLKALIGLVVALTITLGFVRPADARAKVDVAVVELSSSASSSKDRDRRLTATVRRLAQQSAKHLDFGKSGRVEVSFLVKELKIVEVDGLLRVTCTLVGKLKGGGSAKSRLSFGGKPAKKKQIEKEVLASVTDGVMTRLAEMSRAKK